VLIATPTDAATACKYASDPNWRQTEHANTAGSKYFGKCVPTNRSGYPASSPNDFRFYIDCNKKLTVYKTGSVVAMPTNDGSAYDFGDIGNLQPWYNLRTNITSAELGAGITAIGRTLFANLAITTIKFPSTIQTLGSGAGYMNAQLKTIDMTEVHTVPAFVSAYTISTCDCNATAGRAGITLLIDNVDVGAYSTAAATNNRHLWKEYIIPQLMFKFDTQGGVFMP
jgi:hypothetical protein